MLETLAIASYGAPRKMSWACYLGYTLHVTVEEYIVTAPKNLRSRERDAPKREFWLAQQAGRRTAHVNYGSK